MYKYINTCIYIHISCPHIYTHTRIYTHAYKMYIWTHEKHVWNDGAAATVRAAQIDTKKLCPYPCPLASGTSPSRSHNVDFISTSDSCCVNCIEGCSMTSKWSYGSHMCAVFIFSTWGRCFCIFAFVTSHQLACVCLIPPPIFHRPAEKISNIRTHSVNCWMPSPIADYCSEGTFFGWM